MYMAAPSPLHPFLHRLPSAFTVTVLIIRVFFIDEERVSLNDEEIVSEGGSPRELIVAFEVFAG